MFRLKIFVRVQTFRRVPPALPRNFCHPGEIPNASDTAEMPTPMRPAYSCVQYNQEPSPPHRRNIKLDTIIFFAYAKVKPNQHDAEERHITQPVYPILDSLAQSDGSSIPA